MNNQRRRRTTLFMMILCAEAFPVVKRPAFAALAMTGPFAVSPHISKLFDKEVPNQAQRNKEFDAARKVVNRVFGPLFHQWDVEVKLYVLCQTVKRMLADGWTPSRLTELEGTFVYRLYQMADAIRLDNLSDHVVRAVAEAPDKLRAEGLFTND